MNRVQDVLERPAGKGLHAAMMLKELGGEPYYIGPGYHKHIEEFGRLLQLREIRYYMEQNEGAVRTNLKIFDQSKAMITEVNEKGHPLSRQVVEQLIEQIMSAARCSTILSLNGSTPCGMDKDIYSRILHSVKSFGIKTVVDAEGELLLNAVKEAPYFIKPNADEVEKTFGCRINSVGDAVNAASVLLDFGIHCVCISMGASGAVAVTRDEKWFVPALDVPVRGTPAAGDSMLAAMCLGMERGEPLAEQLRLGVASAAATVMHAGNELGTKDEITQLLLKVAPVCI